jgi:transcriptional pleiotropic regulator of transition state genes
MKATGIVRRVDELGRVVLPIELRKSLHIGERDPLEIYTDGNQVVLKKYEPACVFTGSMDDLIEYNGRKIAKKVVKEMAEAAGLL